MSFKVGIIGTGYVGLVSGTTFAATGNNVLCVDIDEAKVEMMRQAKSPIFEPGLERLMAKNIKEGRLNFTTKLEEAVLTCQFIFLCLPTPPNEDGSADLHHVLDVAKDVANILKANNVKDEKIVINKSTVPVGTGEKVKAIFAEILGENNIVNVVSNPEFLSEGFAVEEATYPDRVVVGTDKTHIGELMRDLYKPFVRNNNPILIMDIKSAELTKYAANSFLAVKISYMNELSRYCEAVGADVDKIRVGMGYDPRIGNKFLYAGLGYGGSCFPKDVKALAYSAKDIGVPLTMVENAEAVNYSQLSFFTNKVFKKFGTNLKGLHFALWGLSFKPETDDTREAPAFYVIEELLKAGATISAYDPEAIENTKKLFGNRINYCENQYDALQNADALIIATEWTVFRTPDFGKMKSMLKAPVIIDGRNVYEIKEMKALGFDYISIGRGVQA